MNPPSHTPSDEYSPTPATWSAHAWHRGKAGGVGSGGGLPEDGKVLGEEEQR